MSARPASPCIQQELFPTSVVPVPASDGSNTLAGLVSDYASEVLAGVCLANLAELEGRINDAAFLGRLSAFRPSQPYLRALIANIKVAAKATQSGPARSIEVEDRE